MDYIFENLNAFYGFKSLYQYKHKYAPTSWESRYLAFYPKALTIKVAYAIIKSQNPKAVSDYLVSKLKNKLRECLYRNYGI